MLQISQDITEQIMIEMQLQLLESPDKKKKSYRAIRHDIVRGKQSINSDEVHHPNEKKTQIERVLSSTSNLSILELFAGQGNLTKTYETFGAVTGYDKKHLKTGDSFIEYHRLIANKKKFDVIDLDPYGFPTRLFPDIFLLIDNGIMFVTMPKPYVNILNGLIQTHLTTYFGEPNPSLETIINKIVLFGLCHWRKVQLIESSDYRSVWRLAFHVERVKATDYTGVKNR